MAYRKKGRRRAIRKRIRRKAMRRGRQQIGYRM